MTGLVGAITLPDGTAVRGRGRREPVPAGPLPDFGLYLGKPGQWQPEWAAEWIDWPDFRTPRDGHEAAASIVGAYEQARAGRRVEVACGGGTGRTGHRPRCMVVLAGHPADDAMAWTRRNSGAMRSRPGQRRWVRWFAAERPDRCDLHPIVAHDRPPHLHNPRVSILSRAGLILAATVFAAACAPADAPTAAGRRRRPARRALPEWRLPTLTAGTLTIGTDQPVYQPWYVDDAPENGQGLRERGRLRDRRTTRLPQGQGRLGPGAVQRGDPARPEALRPQPHRVLDHRGAQAGRRLLGAVLRRQAGRRHLADNPFANVTNVADLKEARLGAQVGTTSYDAISAVIEPTTPAAVFNTNDDAKLALSNGQVDAIVVDLPTAFFITSAELENAKIVGPAAGRNGHAEQFGACWTRAAR